MWWKEKGKKEDNNLQQYNNKVCAPFLSCYHTPLCITIELLVVCPPTWTGCSLLRVRSMGILVVLAECSGVFSSPPPPPPALISAPPSSRIYLRHAVVCALCRSSAQIARQVITIKVHVCFLAHGAVVPLTLTIMFTFTSHYRFLQCSGHCHH